MFKRNAVRRGLGAAWVTIFLATLLLPVAASGASRPLMDADEAGSEQPAPMADAQVTGFVPYPSGQVIDTPPLDIAAEPPSGPIEPPLAPLGSPLGSPLDEPGDQAPLAAQATLDVRQQRVEVSPPAVEDWQQGRDGQVITEGNRVRTDSNGSARLVYFEGSTADISPNTGVTVQRLQRVGDNPITNLYQAAGTTLYRVQSLLDASASFQVETPAATAIVRGTDLAVSFRRSTSPAQVLFQNLSPSTSGSTVQVTGFGNTVTLAPGTETLATEGQGPAPAVPVGRTAQQTQNNQAAVEAAAGGQASAFLASQGAQAAAQGQFQAAQIQQAQVQQFQQQQFQQQVLGPPLLPPGPPPFLQSGPAPLVVSNVGCFTATPVRTPTNTPTRTFTPTGSPTNTPITLTPTPSTTATATPTVVPTVTNTAVVTPGATAPAQVVVPGAGVFSTQVLPVCGPTPGTQIVSQSATQVATPGLTGLAVACYAGQPIGTVCPVTGLVSGSVTRVSSAAFNLTATGITGVTVGGIPLVFIPTTAGVESFSCSSVTATFVTTCTGTTVGDPRSGATVTVRFPLLGGGTFDVTGVIAAAVVPGSSPSPVPTATARVLDPVEVVTNDGSGSNTVFVAQRAADAVSVIDAGTDGVTNRIPLPTLSPTTVIGGLTVGGSPVNPIAITFIGAVVGPGANLGKSFIWTGNLNGTVSAIDVASQTVVATINLAGGVNVPGPAITVRPEIADLIAFTPDGGVTDVWVTDRANHVIHIIDAPSNTLAARIDLKSVTLPFTNPTQAPGGAASLTTTTTPDPQDIRGCLKCPNLLFVALRNSNAVAVINGITKTLSGAIAVGTRPTGMDIPFQETTQYLYVANTGSNNVSVIELNPTSLVSGIVPPAPTPAPTPTPVPPGVVVVNPAPATFLSIVATLGGASGFGVNASSPAPDMTGPFRITTLNFNAPCTTGPVPSNTVYVSNGGDPFTPTAGSNTVSVFNVVTPCPPLPSPPQARGLPNFVGFVPNPNTGRSITIVNAAGAPVPPRGEDSINGINHVYVAVPTDNSLRVIQGVQVIATIR
jgi:hypothetical protein